MYGSPAVLAWRGERFVIERHSSGLIHTDGETHVTSARVEITIRPRSLRLIFPRETSLESECSGTCRSTARMKAERHAGFAGTTASIPSAWAAWSRPFSPDAKKLDAGEQGWLSKHAFGKTSFGPGGCA
jgi:hypothetical protein